MDRLIFAGEILKLAKELVSMDFDTEAEKKKYEQEHEVRPGTKLTVKKDEKPSAPAAPSSAPAKHDFSSEGFYSQRPKLKGAVEKTRGAVAEIEKLEAAKVGKRKEHDELWDKTSREVKSIRDKHGVSKYSELPEDVQKAMDKMWEPVRKLNADEEGLDDQIFQKKEEIEKAMADTEVPEAAEAFKASSRSDAKELKGKLNDLHMMYHGTQLRKKTEGIPSAKHEDVKEGDHLLGKRMLYRVDKRTPSGQLKMTNLNSGEKLIETAKSWQNDKYRKLDPETTEHTLALLEEFKKHHGAGKEARITERVAKELFAWGSRRTVSGDPYWMTVRYPGHCHKCHAPIERGEQAFFYPKGRYLFGEKCGHGKEAEDDFLTHSEMDTFSNQGDFE